MRRRPGVPHRHRTPRTRGFTLVELLVAVMVMTVGILGLASIAGAVTRMMNGAVRQSIAANVVETRFEKLRNQSCATVSSGSATARNISERWSVAAAGTNLIQIVDSVSFATMSGRPSVTRVYWSYGPCRN